MEQNSNIPSRISESILSLNKTKALLNFFFRYSKPILNNLIYYKIIAPLDINKYSFLFKHYNISNYSPLNSDSNFLNGYSFSPDGYFKIVLKTLVDSKHLNFILLKNELSSKFNTKEGDFENSLFIPIENISEFYELYKGREIEWSFFCKQKGTLWTDKVILELRDVLDWECLHRNPSVNWNFNLVNNNCEYVNWAFISSYPSLKWNFEHLNKFKEYLIFSLDNKSLNKGGENRRGKRFYLLKESDGLKGHIYANLKGSISLSESVEWSEEVIINLQDYWNWTELSSNTSIHWTDHLIDLFSRRIDFKALSINPAVNWTEELIEKYLDKWNWDYLSGNYSLPWSYKFIKKYEDKWKWKGSYYKKTRYSKESYQISLSTNQGIVWNEKMLLEWRDNVDFWSLARFSRIESDSIKLFYKEFDKQKLTELHYRKNSDWGWEEIESFRNGWGNLALNTSFFLKRNDVFDFYNFKIIDQEQSNESKRKDILINSFTLLDKLKRCSLTGISIEDLLENEHSWTQCLINENFINDSIWKNLIEPIFTTEFCHEYLDQLNSNLENINN